MINKIVFILLIINLFTIVYLRESFSYIWMNFTAIVYCLEVIIRENKK